MNPIYLYLNDPFKPAAAVAIASEIKHRQASQAYSKFESASEKIKDDEASLERLTAPFGNGYLWP